MEKVLRIFTLRPAVSEALAGMGVFCVELEKGLVTGLEEMGYEVLFTGEVAAGLHTGLAVIGSEDPYEAFAALTDNFGLSLTINNLEWGDVAKVSVYEAGPMYANLQPARSGIETPCRRREWPPRLI